MTSRNQEKNFIYKGERYEIKINRTIGYEI